MAELKRIDIDPDKVEELMDDFGEQLRKSVTPLGIIKKTLFGLAMMELSFRAYVEDHGGCEVFFEGEKITKITEEDFE